MKVGILLFEQFYGKENIGSSRIRGHWIAKHWRDIQQNVPALDPEVALSGCEVYRMAQKYDVMIYQKVYWVEHAEKFQGVKILDMCDPDFLHWGYRVKQMADLCDAVTTSTVQLADFMRKYTDKPVIHVPDRMDIESFGDLKKVHTGKAKVAAWFGYSENFPMLDQAVTSIIKSGFEELMVIAGSKMPYQLPAGARTKILLNNVAWTAETVNKDLMLADVIVNPQSNVGRWKYKSNNKTITAWALGLPVAHTALEMKLYLDEAPRREEGEKRYREAREKWDVRMSVSEMKKIISDAYEARKAKA